MSLSRAIAHNTLLQFIGKLLTTGMGIVAFAMMTRYLDPEGYGAYTTISTFLQLFGIIADCGLSLVALQLMAEKDRDPSNVFSVSLTIRFIVITTALLLAPLISLVFPYSPAIKLGIVFFAFSFWLSSLMQMLRVVFQVRLRMDIPLIADIVSFLVLIGGMWAAVALDWGLFGILGAITMNNLVQLAMLALLAQRFLPFRFQLDRGAVRVIMSRSWPIALSILFNLAYLRTDALILSLTQPQTDVGWYGAAYRVLDVLTTVPAMFMGIVIPSFARAWSRADHVSFKRYFQKSFDFMMLLACPTVVGTFFIATPLMILVSGNAFAPAGAILAILGIAGGILFVASFFAHLVNVIHEQRAMLMWYALTAGVGILGYILFIPRYSYWGAAWVTVCAEIAILVSAGVCVMRKTRCLPHLVATGKILLASAIMALFLATTGALPLMLRIAGAVCIYAGVLMMLKVVSTTTLRELLMINSSTSPRPPG